jgi:phage gp16-like protein
VPITLDRRVAGYCYVSTKANSHINPAQPNGIVDVSVAHYTKDKQLVNSLADIVIRSFNKQMLDNNIKLKSEIADVIMGHRFSDSKLLFVFIPENEVVRLIVNEDENGKGHSIIEPSLFPARMYLLLTMYNMIYTLNNNTTRIHYLKSSGLNKDYAAQVQRAIRKFQSRRITIDDIYSYSGVLNKVGGMGEMVLPSGRGDYKAIETDTIAAVDKPIDTEFLEQQRRQAISGTGVPALMVINALDEVDFAKTLEMANTRYLSTVSSYKIDFNKGLTRFYQLILKHNTDLTDNEINSFLYKFNNIRQPALNITNQMINDFNTLNELAEKIYFSNNELQTEDEKPSNIAIMLKKELAQEYLPQLDLSKLDEVVERVRIKANEMTLKQKAASGAIDAKDIDSIKNA